MSCLVDTVVAGEQVNHQSTGFIAHVCRPPACSALQALHNIICWTYFFSL